MSNESVGNGFVYVEQSLTPTGQTQSAPPVRKKPRTYRGQNSKSHEGDRPPNPNKIHTGMAPEDYLQTIQCTELKDKEKLPCHMMTRWKRANDTDTFTRQINQGTDLHQTNPTLQYMKENYRNIMENRPVKNAPGSPRQSSGSQVIVHPTIWEDVSVDQEITLPLKHLTLESFPVKCHRTIGNTDTDETFKK